MTPQIATYIFVALIIGLFWLTRDRETQFSKALWLPLVWLWLTSSRSVTEWVAIAQTGRPLAATLLSSATRAGDRSNSYIEGTPLDRTVLIGLMSLALIVLIKRKRFGALLRMNLPIVLFLLYAAFSALWSDFPDVTIRRWFKAAGCLMMIMVVLSERDRDAAMKRLFVWAGFLLIPHSILLIKYYPAIGRTYNRWTWLVSYVGVTTHKNSLGGICQVYGVAFVWHLIIAYRDRLRADRRRRLIAYGAAIAMVVYLFWLANSMTAQSVFLLAAALIVAAQMRAVVRKPWLVHVVMLLLVAVPFATLFLGVGGSALEGMGRDSTLTGRTDIWARVISMVNNPIVGTGFESFWLGGRLEAMDRYQLGLNEAHNGYLEIYISLGWIGVVFLAIMIVKGYRNIMMLYRMNPKSAVFRLAFFLTVIVASFTEAAFRTESISWIAFLLMTTSTPEDRLPEGVRSARLTAPTSGPTRLGPLPVVSALRAPVLGVPSSTTPRPEVAVVAMRQPQR